jgi:hypothetical protein
MGRSNSANRIPLAGEPVGSRGGLVVDLSVDLSVLDREPDHVGGAARRGKGFPTLLRSLQDDISDFLVHPGPTYRSVRRKVRKGAGPELLRSEANDRLGSRLCENA